MALHDNYQVAGIEHIPNRARLRVLGCDPRRAHGLAPLSGVTNPRKWEFSKSERMISALRTGLGKVPGSRLIAIGTRPASSDHWFAAMFGTRNFHRSTPRPTARPPTPAARGPKQTPRCATSRSLRSASKRSLERREARPAPRGRVQITAIKSWDFGNVGGVPT